MRNAKTQFVSVCLLLIIAMTGWAQDDPYLLDFSGITLEENQISAQGAGFGAFPQGSVEFGSIPTDNAFEGATDGHGAIITCQPGEGVMLIAPNIQSDGALLLHCSIRADGPHGSIVIATVDQSSNTFVSTNTPNNGGYFLNQYRKLGVLSIPSPNQIMPILQVYNPSEIEPLVVYLDNFEFFVLDQERYYNAELFTSDGSHPDVISIGPGDSPEPTPTPSPTPTQINIPTINPTFTIPTFTVPTFTIPTFTIPTGFPTIPGESTPTPQVPATPTPEPSGTAVGLRLTVCEAPGVASSAGFPGSDTPVSVIVDLIDSNGAIVNPGTEGGDSPVMVNLSVDGSAELDIGGQTDQFILNHPEGEEIFIYNDVAETVTITASAEGLNDAEPVQVEFVPSGSISGTMRVWDGASLVTPEAGFDVDIEVLQTTANRYSYYDYSIDAEGNYTISGLIPGTYTIRFTPLEQFTIPGLPGLPEIPEFPEIPELPGFSLMAKKAQSTSYSPTQFLPVVESSDLAWVCQTNLTVTANQVLPNVNVDFGPRQSGATVSGTITRADGNVPTNATVLLVPQGYYEYDRDPNVSIDCNIKTFTTNLLNIFGDPNFDATFEFTGVPGGTYQLHVVEYPFDEDSESLLTNGMGQTVVVSSANVRQDVEISQSGTIFPISPVNYSRISASPVFEIERSPEYLNQEVSVMLFDRCFNEVWSQDGVLNSEIQYTGPALSNQDMYYWFISPNEFNPFFFNLIFNEENNVPVFLVE